MKDTHGLNVPSHDGIVSTSVKRRYIVEKTKLTLDIFYAHVIFPVAVLKVITNAHTSHSFELTNYYLLEDTLYFKRGDRIIGYENKNLAIDEVECDKKTAIDLLHKLKKLYPEN